MSANYAIRVEHCPGRPIAVVRRRAAKDELGSVIREACGTVWKAVRAENLSGAGRHLALYLDDVGNLEIGVELESPFQGCGHVYSSVLPSGEVAVTTHFGPYELLGAAHEAIQRWLKANAKQSAGPCWELYGHWDDAWNKDPSRIRTDVYYLFR